MVPRSPLARRVLLSCGRQQRGGCVPAPRRTYASAAPTTAPSASYENHDISSIKVAVRDLQGPTTKLAIVAKAGTRYEPAPGLTAGLEQYAFKNTYKRSALRITRECELLGAQLASYHNREALVIEASFLREQLPYFAELLAEVATQTKYTTYEFHEDVERTIHHRQAKLSSLDLALDAAHAVAFHSGLGEPLYPSTSTPTEAYVNEHTIAGFAEAAFNKANMAVVADGASKSELEQWLPELFKGLPVSPANSQVVLKASPSTYHGGEQRISGKDTSAMVIGLPSKAASDSTADMAVLTALLGGKSSIKWTPGFSLLSRAAASATGAHVHAVNLAYTDAGLMTIQITGSASAVAKVARESVTALKSLARGTLAKEDLSKAIAAAKFNLLSNFEHRGVGLVAAGTTLIHGGQPLKLVEAVKKMEGVTVERLKTTAKKLLDGKASVAAAGDLHVLPYARDIELTV